MPQCVVYKCNEFSRKGGWTSMHKFPNDPKLRKKWCAMIRRENFVPRPSSLICSKHFEDDAFEIHFGRRTIKKGAYPTLFDYKERSKPPKVRDTSADNSQASRSVIDMTRCVAVNCNEIARSGGPSMHRFPKDPKLLKKWCAMVRRENFVPTEHSTLCSKHFEKDAFEVHFGMCKIRKGAVPTIFDYQKKPKSRKPPKERNTTTEHSQTSAKNSTAVDVMHPGCQGKEVSVPLALENSSIQLNEVENSSFKKTDDSVVADDTDVRKTSTDHSRTNAMESIPDDILHPDFSRKDISIPAILENSATETNMDKNKSIKKTDHGDVATDAPQNIRERAKRRKFVGDFKLSDMASPMQAALFYESAMKIIEDKNKRIHFFARKTRTLQSKVQDLTSLLQLCQKSDLSENAVHMLKKPPARQDFEMNEFGERIEAIGSNDGCNESEFSSSTDFAKKTSEEVPPSKSGTLKWHIPQADQPSSSNIYTVGEGNKTGKGAPTNGSNVDLQENDQRKEGNDSDDINVRSSIEIATNGLPQPQFTDQSGFWMGNIPNVPMQLQNMDPYRNNIFINCGSMMSPFRPPVNGLSQSILDTYGSSCVAYGGNMPFMIGMRPQSVVTLQPQQTSSTINGLPVNVQMTASITSHVPDRPLQQEQRSKSKQSSTSNGENIPRGTKNSAIESTVLQYKDYISIYCENVASRLRALGHSDMSALIAKHEIDNILFKLEMKQLDKPTSLTNIASSGSPSSACLSSDPSSVQTTTSNISHSAQSLHLPSSLPPQIQTNSSDKDNLTQKCLPEQLSNILSSSSKELASNPSTFVSSLKLEPVESEEIEDVKHFNDILIFHDLSSKEKDT